MEDLQFENLNSFRGSKQATKNKGKGGQTPQSL